MRIIAVPVKSLSAAKTRLSPLLSPLERAALSLAMLEDVLDAALDMAGWETWVVSPDETVLEIAARRRARPVPEERPPLSAAVRQVEEESSERGASALALLLGDLPLLTREALAVALRTIGPVVAAPARGNGGTNLLLRRPPRAIVPRFGRDSFRKHCRAAEVRGIPVSVVDRPEISFDLDLPSDVEVVLTSRNRGRTWSACHGMGLMERLPVRA